VDSRLVVLAAATSGFLLLRTLARGRRFDASWTTFAKAPWNALSFAARRRIAWSRGLPELPNEPKGELFAYLDDQRRRAAEAREHDLRTRYDLERLAARSTCEVYRENLYVLDVLDRIGGRVDAVHAALSGPRVTAIDVGSKDFVYATALDRWLRGHGAREVALLGVEIDGHVVYRDLHARCDWARAYARATGNAQVEYRVQDFRDTPERDRDVITLFYPFLFRYALLAWGLPLERFSPGALLDHAIAALRPAGLLVIATHTLEERDALAALLAARSDVTVEVVAPFESVLVDYWAEVAERHLTIARRSSL
jgi:SAM-dependent methyltransferase